MKHTRTLGLSLTLAAVAVPLFVASCAEDTAQSVLEARLSGSLVISQVYGGGGNSGASYRNDFVEVFNRSASNVSLAGLSIQYASATGNFQASNVVALPSVTLAPGQYFLLGMAGGTTGTALPTADATATINMSAAAGKVALVDGTTAIACTNGVCALTDVIDYVGYGSTATQFEGSGAATLPSGNAGSVQRRMAGCAETNDNHADFESPALTASPRNTNATRNVCIALTDSGIDTGPADAPMDTTMDDVNAGNDAARDVLTDVAMDAAIDVTLEAAADVPVEIDASTDTGTDAGQALLVISQVYGAGGNSGATYQSDFVEIFNRGGSPASLAGRSIQYASATGNFQTSNVVTLPAVVLAPGRYFLVALASGTSGMALPTADLTNTAVNLSSTAGRVALVNGTTALMCTGGICDHTNVVDYVGYGTTADEYEGPGPAPAASAAQSSQRLSAGCVDTDDNRANFESRTANARNSASPANNCTTSPVDAGTDASTGTDVVMDTADPDAAFDGGIAMDVPTMDSAPTDVARMDANDASSGARPTLVISQIFGGGGNASATYANDFVELFNRGTQDANTDGLSIQYASSTGTFSASGVTVLPNATIPPGGYFLVQMASSGTVGGALPGSDFANTAVNLSGSAGKVALVLGTTALGCGGTTACPSASLVDLVGYGTAATLYEGSGAAAAPTTNVNSVQRRRAGCVDTDDNNGDFERPVIAVRPRSSGSAHNDCSATSIDAGAMDSGTDASVADVARDVRTDTGSDITLTDARTDVATDGAVDAGLDAARDVASDSATDVVLDAPSSDVAADGPRDVVAADAARDARSDAAGDSAMRDASPDAGGFGSPPGCRCSTPGADRSSSTHFAWSAAPLFAAIAVRRRRRATKRTAA